MEDEEFYERIASPRSDAIERIIGLLTGTNDEDDNLMQILDDHAFKIRSITNE